jgi:hypothetical protein
LYCLCCADTHTSAFCVPTAALRIASSVLAQLSLTLLLLHVAMFYKQEETVQQMLEETHCQKEQGVDYPTFVALMKGAGQSFVATELGHLERLEETVGTPQRERASSRAAAANAASAAHAVQRSLSAEDVHLRGHSGQTLEPILEQNSQTSGLDSKNSSHVSLKALGAAKEAEQQQAEAARAALTAEQDHTTTASTATATTSSTGSVHA